MSYTIPANFGLYLEGMIQAATMDFPDIEDFTSDFFDCENAAALDENSGFAKINLETSLLLLNLGTLFYHFVFYAAMVVIRAIFWLMRRYF